MSAVVLVLALLGFTTQVMYVSIQYFAYVTITQVRISIPTYVQPHSIALCFYFQDILDASVDRQDATNLSIADIWRLTPNELTDNCYRRVNEWRLELNK